MRPNRAAVSFGLILLILSSVAHVVLSLSTPAEVTVCTNRFCAEKGSDATLATFSFFATSDVAVKTHNCFGRCNKGPNVKITKAGTSIIHESVRSVETVVNLLQNELGVNVNLTAAEVLRLNYDGNLNLSEGKVEEAILCYDKALSLGDANQEGILRLMRGTALLQRSYSLRY